MYLFVSFMICGLVITILFRILTYVIVVELHWGAFSVLCIRGNFIGPTADQFFSISLTYYFDLFDLYLIFYW